MNITEELLNTIQEYADDGYGDIDIGRVVNLAPSQVARIKNKYNIRPNIVPLEELDAKKGVRCNPFVNTNCIYGCRAKDKTICYYSVIEGKPRTIRRLYDKDGRILKDVDKGGYLVEHINPHRCCHCFVQGKPITT